MFAAPVFGAGVAAEGGSGGAILPSATGGSGSVGVPTSLLDVAEEAGVCQKVTNSLLEALGADAQTKISDIAYVPVPKLEEAVEE